MVEAHIAQRLLYGGERLFEIEALSMWIWAFAVPASAIALALPSQGASIAVLVGLYSLQTYRIARYRHLAHGDASPDAWLYGLFCVLGKVPELQGQLEFWLRLLLGRQRGLIEYKQPVQL